MKKNFEGFILALLALCVLPPMARAQTYSGYGATFGPIEVNFYDFDLSPSGSVSFSLGNTATMTESLTVDAVNGTLTEAGSVTIPAFTITERFSASYTTSPLPPLTPVTYTGIETLTITSPNPVTTSFNSGALSLTHLSGTTYGAYSYTAINVPLQLNLSIYTNSDGITHNDPQINTVLSVEMLQRPTINIASFPTSIDPVTLAAGLIPSGGELFTPYTAPNGLHSQGDFTVPEPSISALILVVAAPFLFCRRTRRRQSA